MGFKPLSILLLSGIWFCFCHYWYCGLMQSACYHQKDQIAATPPVIVEDNQDPLTFQWSDKTPFTTNKFPDLKDKIINKFTDDNLLIITGKYFNDEKKPENFDNLGIARAAEIRDILKDAIPEERIRISSKKIKIKKGVKQNRFKSATFRWVKSKTEGSEIVNLSEKDIILFPYNSAKKKVKSEIDDYLTILANRVKKSGEVIVLTGHTDSNGSTIYNEKLGLKRAKRIRRLLRLKGVERDQIITKSKGESEPVATNDSDEGKHQNRRVEVELSNKK